MFRNAGFWKITQAVLPEADTEEKERSLLQYWHPVTHVIQLESSTLELLLVRNNKPAFFINLFTTTIISTSVSVY